MKILIKKKKPRSKDKKALLDGTYALILVILVFLGVFGLAFLVDWELSPKATPEEIRQNQEELKKIQARELKDPELFLGGPAAP